jgi:hypothetical protein
MMALVGFNDGFCCIDVTNLIAVIILAEVAS